MAWVCEAAGRDNIPMDTEGSYRIFERTDSRSKIDEAIPICGRTHLLPEPRDFLNHLRIAISLRPVATEIVAVEEIDVAVLAAGDRQVRIGPGLVRQQNDACRSQIQIIPRHSCLIERSEVIQQRYTGRPWFQLHDAVAQVRTGFLTKGVEGAIGNREIEIAVGIRGNSAAAHPNASLVAVGSGNPTSGLLQRRRVVRNDPAVISAKIAVGCKRNIQPAFVEQQCGPLQVEAGVESKDTVGAFSRGAGIRRLDSPRPAEFFRTRSQIQSVEPVIKGAVLLGGRYYIDGVAGHVDDRSAGDSYLRHDIARVHVRGCQAGYANIGVEEVDSPCLL